MKANKRNRLTPYVHVETEHTANGDGQVFLDELLEMSGEGFQARFSRISTRLGLGAALNSAELKLLYQAAYLATLCHISFNGLGGGCGVIRPEQEINRIKLEQNFMTTQQELWASPKWRALPVLMKEATQRIFLTAYVEKENLRF